MIDCHAHFADPSFDGDRGEVRIRAVAASVRAILAVGEDLEDNARVWRIVQETAGAKIGTGTGGRRRLY